MTDMELKQCPTCGTEEMALCSLSHVGEDCDKMHLWQCSECGCLAVTLFANAPAYCPWCGARVVM